MNHKDTFILHGTYDISTLTNILNSGKVDWDTYTDRQDRFKAAHGHTKTIPIIFDKSFNYDHLRIVPTEHYPLFKEELSKIEHLINSSTNQNGKIMRALLVKLNVGGSIPPHVDTVGFSLVVCRRIHIPLQTNNECYFTVGTDKRNLKLGEVWEINNDKQMHSVVNFGTTDRIHLIVDWVEESLLEL